MPHARTFSALLWIALMTVAGTLTAQDAAFSTAPASTSRRPLFTPEELDRARAIAAERQERLEGYLRESHDDDVIVLAPYIVEGDNSLLVARLRRDLERGSGAWTHRPIRIKTPTLRVQDFGRKSDYMFFHARSPGAPGDRPNPVDWLGISVGIFSAVLQKRPGDIFRAPPNPAFDQ